MFRWRLVEWALLAAFGAVFVAALVVGSWFVALYMGLLVVMQVMGRVARREAYRAGYFLGRGLMLAQLTEGGQRGLTPDEIGQAIAESDKAKALDRKWPR